MSVTTQTGIVAAKKPAVLALAAGEYWWCRCGRSGNQPFCDGSHKGTAFEPMRFVLEAPKRVAVCQCKQTKTAPFCDGSHRSIV